MKSSHIKRKQLNVREVIFLEFHLCPVSTVANVENKKIRIENNNGSDHIPHAFLSILVHSPHVRVAFCILPRSRDRHELGRMQNNATRT